MDDPKATLLTQIAWASETESLASYPSPVPLAGGGIDVAFLRDGCGGEPRWTVSGSARGSAPRILPFLPPLKILPSQTTNPTQPIRNKYHFPTSPGLDSGLGVAPGSGLARA